MAWTIGQWQILANGSKHKYHMCKSMIGGKVLVREDLNMKLPASVPSSMDNAKPYDLRALQQQETSSGPLRSILRLER